MRLLWGAVIVVVLGVTTTMVWFMWATAQTESEVVVALRDVSASTANAQDGVRLEDARYVASMAVDKDAKLYMLDFGAAADQVAPQPRLVADFDESDDIDKALKQLVSAPADKPAAATDHPGALRVAADFARSQKGEVHMVFLTDGFSSTPECDVALLLASGKTPEESAAQCWSGRAPDLGGATVDVIGLGRDADLTSADVDPAALRRFWKKFLVLGSATPGVLTPVVGGGQS
jgi:hypothetical protein